MNTRVLGGIIINKADLNSEEEFILAVTKASMQLMRDTAEDKQAKSPGYWKNIFFSAADAYRYLEDIFDYDDSLRDAYSVNFNGISFLGHVALDTVQQAEALSAYEYYLSLREKNESLFDLLESFCRNVQYYGLYICILDEEGYPCFEPPVSPEEEKGFYICDKGKDGSYRFVEDYANYQIKSEMGSYIREAAEYGSFFHVFCLDPGSNGYTIFKVSPEGIDFVDEKDLISAITDIIKDETMFSDIEEYMDDCVFAGDIPEIFE